MTRRRIALAAGVAAALAGLVVAFVPGVAPAVGASELVLVAGGATVLAGVVRARAFLLRDADDYEMPSPERGRRVAVPGDSFDETLSSVPRVPVPGDQRWSAVRDELRESAVEVLTRYHGATPAEAHRMLEEGEWTDDPYAAEFFAALGRGGGSLTESVWASVGGPNPFVRRARHASAEIYRLAGGEGE